VVSEKKAFEHFPIGSNVNLCPAVVAPLNIWATMGLTISLNRVSFLPPVRNNIFYEIETLSTGLYNTRLGARPRFGKKNFKNDRKFGFGSPYFIICPLF
jgi:hypothetical protein